MAQPEGSWFWLKLNTWLGGNKAPVDLIFTCLPWHTLVSDADRLSWQFRGLMVRYRVTILSQPEPVVKVCCTPD